MTLKEAASLIVDAEGRPTSDFPSVLRRLRMLGKASMLWQTENPNATSDTVLLDRMGVCEARVTLVLQELGLSNEQLFWLNFTDESVNEAIETIVGGGVCHLVIYLVQPPHGGERVLHAETHRVPDVETYETYGRRFDVDRDHGRGETCAMMVVPLNRLFDPVIAAFGT